MAYFQQLGATQRVKQNEKTLKILFEKHVQLLRNIQQFKTDFLKNLKVLLHSSLLSETFLYHM